MDSINDLFVREFMSGTLFLLGLFLVVAMGFRLWQRVGQPGWRLDDGTTAVVALFFFMIGESMRSGWIWLLLACQNEYGRARCQSISSSYEFLVVASAFAIVGATCCIRVFSPPHLRSWAWLGAGALAIALPIAVHLL